jgi:serine/threonine-protein kinase
VAVMPFVNMSGDPAKEYLGDGMSEEILNDLANTSNLRVAARTSSFAFKGKQADIHEIARKLNVRTVLEGSVRQDGDRVRVVAQLIDSQSGFHLWSARYDSKLDDILTVQDKIAGAIARALSQKLLLRHARRAIHPEVYRDYLQAQYFFRQRTVIGFKRADELLKSVLKRQPDFAAAYAMRAHLLILTVGGDPAELAEVHRMVAKALQLEPGNQDALDTRLEFSLANWDWAAAYGAGHQLLAQPSRSANAYNGIGFFYQYMGFPKLALEARRRAAELDPLAFSYRNNLAMAQWHVGRLNEAIATALAALDLQPNHLGALYNLCQMNAAAGKISEARRYAKLIAALPSPQFSWVPSACEIEVAFGEHKNAEARTLLDHLDANKIGNTRFGLLYARAGDLNRAMDCFSKAYDRRDQSLVWVRYDAATPKSLLGDPRWRALWQRPLLTEWQRYHDRMAAELAAGRLH